MNIDNFIRNKPCASGDVDFEGLFEDLYVRLRPPLTLNGKRYTNVIRLSLITAKQPGCGSFKRLIAHLTKTYPGSPIVIEEVLTSRFAEGIVRMGGQQITVEENPSFVFKNTYYVKLVNEYYTLVENELEFVNGFTSEEEGAVWLNKHFNPEYIDPKYRT